MDSSYLEKFTNHLKNGVDSVSNTVKSSASKVSNFMSHSVKSIRDSSVDTIEKSGVSESANSDAIKKIFDAARRADGLSGSKINNLQKQMQAGDTMIKNLSKCFCMDNRFDCHAMEINVLTSGGDEYYTMWDLWRKSQIRKITDDNIIVDFRLILSKFLSSTGGAGKSELVIF